VKLIDAADVVVPRTTKVSLDNLDDVQLPVRVPVYTEPDELRPIGSLDATGQLDELVDISLREARTLIETPWDLLDPKIVNTKASLIQTVFSTQTKVDDTRLRRRQVDMLPKLLELIAREEMKVVGG